MRSDDELDIVSAMKGANLALAFLLELAALAAFAWGGWAIGPNTPARVILVVALPAAAAACWGAFLSPKPAVQLPTGAIAAVQLGFFALAAIALWASGAPGLAIALAVAVVINRVLLRL